MRRLTFVILVFAIILGCGGGGGSNSGSSATGSGTTGATYEIRIPGADPNNLLYGHKYQIQLWRTDGGVASVVPIGGAKPGPTASGITVEYTCCFDPGDYGACSLTTAQEEAATTLHGVIFEALEKSANCELPIQFHKGPTFRCDVDTDVDGGPAVGLSVLIGLKEEPYSPPDIDPFYLAPAIVGSSGAVSFDVPMNAKGVYVNKYANSTFDYFRAEVGGITYDLPALVPIAIQPDGGLLSVHITYLRTP